jgi:spermidine synthase
MTKLTDQVTDPVIDPVTNPPSDAPSDAPSDVRPLHRLALGLFFLSGASGLVFEMVWTRGLTLVFGSTTLAISTVLTAFMGGLGLGSALAGKTSDRIRDPLRAYALAELGVGLYALALPLVLARYPALNSWLWASFGDAGHGPGTTSVLASSAPGWNYAVLSTLRFLASAGLLLLPTTLMGATLPLLGRYLLSRPSEMGGLGRRMGSLYAVNLFGAVAGAFFAGFVFLPLLGVRQTNFVAAGINLTLAATVLLARPLLYRLDRRPSLDALAEQMGLAPAPAGPAPAELTASARRLVLAGFALSGLSAMTLQVLWTRALAVVLGSSIFSFTLILLAFLVGLGSGSAVFGRLADRTSRPVRALATLHLGIAAAVGLSYLITDELPFLFAWLVSSTRAGVDAIQVCQFVAACATVLPATFLMGGVFPLSIRVLAARFDRVGTDLGRAYGINTLGAIAGSFLSGFVVLPLLGLQRGIYAAALVGLLLAAALFGVAPALTRRQRLVGAGMAAALAVTGALLPRWNLINFSVGFFRVSIAKDYIERRAQRRGWEKPELVFYEDGVATTVSVDRWGKTFSLKNNGKVDASSEADMPTQIAVGLLPLLLYPHDVAQRPPRVALVGFGSGATAGSITQFPIASLEVVELEPAVYRASRFFEAVNRRPLTDPRVRARIGDGRNFLTQRRDPFDVIVSQPSNPWITGVSNLFTREYFQAVKTRLAPGGIFCQWAQLYELAPWNVKSIYRTLRAEFAHVLVFSPEDLSSDTILIASNSPLRLDRRRVEQRLADPTTGAEARRAGLASAHDVFAHLLLGPEEVESFSAGAELNTDDNARIEFSAPRDLLGYSRFEPYLARVYGPRWPYGRLSELVDGYEGPQAAARADLARSLLSHGKTREAELWTRKAEASGGGPEAERARLLLQLVDTREDRDPEIPLAAGGDLEPPQLPPELAAEHGDRVRREYAEIQALMRAHRYASAYKVLEGWPEALWGRLGKDFALLSGFLHYKVELYADAVRELKPLVDDPSFVRTRPAVLYYVGRAHYASVTYGKAVAALERYIDAQRAAGQPLLPASAR